jgi:hypothetical protein
LVWPYVFGDRKCIPIIIDADSLSLLHHELYDLRSNWFNFGVQLNIDNGTLQSIKRQFTDDVDALREVLTHWLKGTPTWEELFKALQSRPVGAHDIQRKIEEDQLSSESVPEGTKLSYIIYYYSTVILGNYARLCFN